MPCAMWPIWVRTCERRKRLNPNAIPGQIVMPPCARKAGF